MKKIFLLFGILLMLPIQPIEAAVTEDDFDFKILAEANERDREKTFAVNEWRVVDGDTADFILDRQQEPSIKARFLLFDAPEVNKSQPYSKAAKQRVEELFSEADQIYVEYEGKEKDHYQRDLVHVWVDDVLLSEILVSEGYAIARYIEDYIPNSKYADIVYASQDYAIRNANNVWKNGDADYLTKAEGLSQEIPTAVNRSEIGTAVNRSEVTTPTTPAPSTSASTTPAVTEPATVVTEPATESVYYQNCTAVRAAGAAPIYPGDPGWDSKFDRDNDGIGCE